MVNRILRFERGANASRPQFGSAAGLQSVNWLARELPAPEHQLEYAQERAIVAVTEAIQRAMDDLGISQRDLASRLGFTEGHVSRLLDGERNMTLRTLGSLLFACGLEVNTVKTEALGVCLMPAHEAEAWLRAGSATLGEQRATSGQDQSAAPAPAVAA